MKQNQFDSVAPVYDFLSKLVFRNSLFKAQTHHLDQIRKGARVLVVGGGTGKILQHPAFQKAALIDYVELSSKMIVRAKKNAAALSNIDFFQTDFFHHHGQYDLIISNFFLDCFDEEHLKQALARLQKQLRPSGQLVVTDFRHTGKLRAKWLIKAMVLFFRVFAGLQPSELLNIDLALQRLFYVEQREFFNNGLVFSFLCRPIEQSASV